MKIIWSILLICIAFSGLSQHDLKELKRAANNTHGNNKVQALLALNDYYTEKYIKSQKADSINNVALALAKKLNYKKGIFEAEMNNVSFLIDSDKEDEALVLLNRLKKEFGGRKNPKNNADILLERGFVYILSQDRQSATADLFAALTYFEKSNDVNRSVDCYSLLSSLFAYEKNYKKAEFYIKKVLPVLDKMEGDYEKALIFSSLSGRFLQLGFNLDTSYYYLSQKYGEKAYSLAKKNDYSSVGISVSQSTSQAFLNTGNKEKAIFYLKESLYFAQNAPPSQRFVSYVGLADYYASEKEYENSFQYLDSARTTKGVQKDHYYMMNLAERDYVYNKEYGNLNAALVGLENYKKYSDSIYKEDQANEILQLNTRFETAKKDQKIQGLTQQGEINRLRIQTLIVVILSVILGLVVLIYLYRQSRLKSKFKIIESEQRLNRARMDPHFFFNALSSIQTMALKEQSPNTAMVLAKFTKVMRQSLESTYLELNTIEDEFAFLKQYLELQKLRYGEKFKYEFDVSEEVEVDEIQIPSMILQPFIENSIEHGFKGMENGGLIVISVRKEGNALEIKVKDNGEELSNKSEEKSHKSRATEIITDRLFLLKKQTGKEAFFEIVRDLNQKGYQIKLTLPLIYKEI